jgi:geranylgeranyl reductase family protein
METLGTQNRFDVAVVGGGPGGATAARRLAQEGFRVILFEKEQLPRQKICAGGIIPTVLRGLPRQAERAIEKQCTRAEIHIVDQNLHFLVSRNVPIVSMTMRSRFDHALVDAAEEAGAYVVPGCKVLDFRENSDGLDVHTVRGVFSTRFLVGADGALSIVARKAGFEGPGYFVPALEAEVQVDANLFGRFESAVRFDFAIVSKGYGWVFPKKDHLSIGVGQMRKGKNHLDSGFGKYLRHLGIEESLVSSKKGFVIPTMPRRDAFARGRALLVGDAAGLADPVTGEGVSAAIESGELAAAALTRGRLQPDPVKSYYEGALRKRILNDLRWSRFVSRLAYDHRKTKSLLFRMCGQQMCETMTDIIFDRHTYRSVFSNPLTYLRMVLPMQRRKTNG